MRPGHVKPGRFHFDQSIIHNLASARASCVSNINKLSLVGMQLPEKYNENFDVSSEGP